MLKGFTRLCSTSLPKNIKVCQNSTTSTVATTTKKYDLFSAVCLERHPTITRPLTDLEKRYMKHLEEMELRNSLKNEFEMRKEAEVKEKDMIAKGLLKVDLDKPITATTKDIEEEGEQSIKDFPFAARITEADEKNIMTSLERKLDKNLLLLVQQKIGKDLVWVPPQSLRAEGETMREAAQRALQEHCGTDLKVKFYGNAPIGVLKYTYPAKIREKLNSHGAKVFYFQARYLKGEVPTKTEHSWMDRGEMKEVLPEKVYKSLSNFLIPE